MGQYGSGTSIEEKLRESEGAIKSWFEPSAAEKAATTQAQLQAEMYGNLQPTLSKIFAGELPEAVVSKVKGYGEDIANTQAETLAGRFQSAGMAFTPTHAGAESDLRSDISRQTLESLGDLQYRMQSSALGQVLGMQTTQGTPYWMQTAYGLGQLGNIF